MRAVPPLPKFPEPAPIRAITDGEFAQLQGFILRVSGIYLSPAKRSLLVGRLTRRLRALGVRSFGEYYRRVVEGGDREEQQQLLDAICTNETHFFREPKHFELLESMVFQRWRTEAATGQRSKQIRIWSAACSTGEEPYTLAMLLLHHFPPGFGWQTEVLATDLSTRVLELARAATWPQEKLHEIQPRFVKRFFLRGVGSQSGRIRARPELRQAVTFEQLNLNSPLYRVGDPFDAIFCRNVLIYFQTEQKRRVIERLLRCLSPNGYLFLGHAETINGLSDELRAVSSTVYVRR